MASRYSAKRPLDLNGIEEPRKQAKLIKPTKTLRELAEQGLLRQVGEAVDGPNPNANYCCGGRVQDSITIRWENPLDNDKPEKITFPPHEKKVSQLSKLANACKHYRLSRRLPTRYFSVNFDPYSAGIIDSIARSILPYYHARSNSHSHHLLPESPALRAQLAGLSVRTVGRNTAYFHTVNNLKRSLEAPGFIKNGGTLGFYCRHHYSHVNSREPLKAGALLGIDRIMACVFKSFGFKVEVRPILSFAKLREHELFEYQMAEESYYDDPGSYIDLEKLCECCEIPEFDTFQEWKAKRPIYDFVGTQFHPLLQSVNQDDNCNRRLEKEIEITVDWEHEKYTDIKWLNERQDSYSHPWELAIINLQFLDDDEGPDIEEYYSLPVLLIKVPKFMDRELKKISVAALKGIEW